jgi:hypothetical protein
LGEVSFPNGINFRHHGGEKETSTNVSDHRSGVLSKKSQVRCGQIQQSPISFSSRNTSQGQQNPLKKRYQRKETGQIKFMSRGIKIISSRFGSLLLGRGGASRGRGSASRAIKPGYPTGPVGSLVRSLVVLGRLVFFFLVLTNKSQGP